MESLCYQSVVNGKENGNYYVVYWGYRVNGKGNGNYYIVYWGYRVNGKQTRNYYIVYWGYRVNGKENGTTTSGSRIIHVSSL